MRVKNFIILEGMTRTQINKTKPFLEVESPLKKVTDDPQKELNLDFLLNDNAIARENLIPKKKLVCRNRKSNYSLTKIKARNFLTNISYTRVKDEDFNNKSFVVNCYSFLLLYLNPFFLEQKFELQNDRQYVEMLWSSMIPNEFYNFICQNDNCTTLNKIKLRFQDMLEIVRNFMDNQENYQKLKEWFKTNRFAIQYLFANLFPRYFSRIDDNDVKCTLALENQLNFYNIQKNFGGWKKSIKKNDAYTSPPTPTIDEPVVDTVKTEKAATPPAILTSVIKKGQKRKNDEKKRREKEKKARLLKELEANTKKLDELKKIV